MGEGRLPGLFYRDDLVLCDDSEGRPDESMSRNLHIWNMFWKNKIQMRQGVVGRW